MLIFYLINIYVSLQEFTIANTNYNINTNNNNALVLVDYANNTQTFIIIPGNYTATTFLTALNTGFSNAANNFNTLTATCSDITNKFSMVATHARTLSISSNSTMNQCIGFPNGLITGLSTLSGANTYSAFTSTTTKPNLIAIYANSNDKLYFTDSSGNNCNIQVPASEQH